MDTAQENKAITIPRNLSIQDIESLYKELENFDEFDDSDIIIPDRIESADFGIVPSLIQFVCTWLRHTNSGKVRITLSAKEDSLERFMEEPHAYPIIVMAWKRGIVDINNRDIKDDIRPLNNSINAKMRALSNTKGQRLLLTCFDHLDRKRGLLDCFYDSNEFIKSEDVLLFTLSDPINQIFSHNKDAASKNIGDKINDILGIMFELVKNTDDWARTDGFNKPFNPNVRGMLLRFLKKKKSTYIETYKSHKGLYDYFDSFSTNDIEELYFLELSVFDSGDGFIRKRDPNGEKKSLKEKVDVIKECLIKHNTHAKGLQKEGKGLGLDRIMNILDEKGLLWIRTDSFSLFRNMKRNRYKAFITKEEVDLFDWTTNSLNEIHEHGSAVGSIVTIIYPIL